MIDYKKARDAALKDVTEFMAVACRTAPKTRGRDNLEILIVDSDKERSTLAKKMKEIAKRDNRYTCERDADNIVDSKYIIVVGTKAEPLGLNCGFCGYETCEELTGVKGVCAYNAMDLGIALGSAASVAARFHVDNRLMYSIGIAAIESGLFKGKIKQAIGIPLSATGKNPFFDRRA
jgi:uncharacterized ferredoxin-like protein